MSNYPPDPDSFYPIVWKIVQQVPEGVVTTFGQIASMIPTPEGADPTEYEKLGPVWVGKAMNAVSFSDNPNVPWQRVINSQGGISLPEGSNPALQQRARLEKEGHSFSKSGRINLNLAGWDGPPEAWLNENGLLPPRSIKKPPDDNPQQLSLF